MKNLDYLLNQEVLVSEYDIYETFADPRRCGGTKYIVFRKGQKYKCTWTNKHSYYYVVHLIGETGAECMMMIDQLGLTSGKFVFDGNLELWDKSYKDWATIKCIKDGVPTFPFTTLTEWREQRIETVFNHSDQLL